MLAKSGTSAVVSANEPGPAAAHVFTLSVENDYTFLVGRSGFVVHNNGSCVRKLLRDLRAASGGGQGGFRHLLTREFDVPGVGNFHEFIIHHRYLRNLLDKRGKTDEGILDAQLEYKAFCSLIRGADKLKHEWIGVENCRHILDLSASPEVARRLFVIMDKCRSPNKTMWFNKKGDSGYIVRDGERIPVGHVGYIDEGGVKATTETYSAAFHNDCYKAFNNNLLTAANGRDIAGIDPQWFDDIENVMNEYFDGAILAERLAELAKWKTDSVGMFGRVVP